MFESDKWEWTPRALLAFAQFFSKRVKPSEVLGGIWAECYNAVSIGRESTSKTIITCAVTATHRLGGEVQAL